MEQLILELLSSLFVLAGTVAIGFIIAWIKRKTTVEQQKLIELIVRDGVLYAQQVFGHLDGPERLEIAMDQILSLLAERGINLDKEQVRVIVESTVKRLKKEFGEEWYK